MKSVRRKPRRIFRAFRAKSALVAQVSRCLNGNERVNVRVCVCVCSRAYVCVCTGCERLSAHSEKSRAGFSISCYRQEGLAK